MKLQKFKLIDDPVVYDLKSCESKISCILAQGELTMAIAEKVCEQFEFILAKVFYALYDCRTNIDGLAVLKIKKDGKKNTFEGQVYWVQGDGDGIGHWFKIDVEFTGGKLLYSYKFYISFENMKQTMFIAKMPDSWVFALNSHQ